MTVDVIGGGRETACGELIRERGAGLNFSHAVILPIPTTRNGIDISGFDIPLDALLEISKEGVLFCSYGVPHRFVQKIEERGGTLIDVSGDEMFTEENAALTAECTLSYIMKTNERALCDLKIGIVGYGRIGKILLELLLFHGAKAKVLTRKNSTRVWLLDLGVESELVADAELSDLDILVNTAPSKLLSKKQCDALSAQVIELAPGENFPSIEKITRLPSLPGKMLPKSSGRLYAEAVMRALEGRCTKSDGQ